MGGRGGGGARNSAPADEFSGALGTRAAVNIKDKITQVLDGQASKYNRNMIKSLVNPEYSPWDEAYSRNCALCTVATVLQLKGYDVEAMPRDKDWRGSVNVFDVDYSNKDNYILSGGDTRRGEPTPMAMGGKNKQIYYNGRTIKDVPTTPASVPKAAKMITDKIKSWGNGAFGEMRVSWKTGGAHSVVLMNVGGKPIIYDSQNHKTYNDFNKYLNQTEVLHTSIRRLDNASVKSHIASSELGKMVKRKDGKSVEILPTKPKNAPVKRRKIQ